MKYLKLFEAFNSFDPYQEVSQDEYENWSQNHKPESFKKSDTLAILEIIDSLWNKKSLDIDFYKNNQKVSTPIRTLFRNDQIWNVEESVFTREEFTRIEVYDNYHYLQIEKWEDEWYTVFYDTYGGGQSHYFIVDTEQGIDWLQDKMSTIYSDVYEGGVDESKEVVIKATLTNDDNELIEDLVLGFVEKWGIENSRFATNGWNLQRHDRFQIWLQFGLEKSKQTPELLSDMKSMIDRIRKFGYNVSEFTHANFLSNREQTIFTFTISHKVEESTITSLTTEDDVVERYRAILDDVSDLLITEMVNWNFIEYDTDDDYNLYNEMYDHPEKDFVFRVRLASWMGHKPAMEHSICIDVVYNTELWANSTGKTAPRLIHDLWKFSRKCVQKLGLTVRPFNKDMSNYDTFFSKITHFHTTGELRFYMGFDDEGTRITNESNMPQKFEADDDEMAIMKWLRFKEEHPQIEFTQSQRNQIQNLLDKSKFYHRWWSGLNGGSEALQIVYNKWTEHDIPQWKSGFNKYVVDISAREDEWFLISEVNNNHGYTDMYLADQFDQVLEFIKSLDPDTDIEANPFGFNQF